MIAQGSLFWSRLGAVTRAVMSFSSRRKLAIKISSTCFCGEVTVTIESAAVIAYCPDL